MRAMCHQSEGLQWDQHPHDYRSCSNLISSPRVPSILTVCAVTGTEKDEGVRKEEEQEQRGDRRREEEGAGMRSARVVSAFHTALCHILRHVFFVVGLRDA